MKRNCDIDNPLVRDGVSQARRLLPAINPADPNFFKVDERSTADLLYFAQRYAGRLQYYDTDNQPAGNWQSFIEHDVAAVIALMSKKDLSRVKDCFDAIVPKMRSSEIFDPAMKNALKLMFDLIFTLARTLDDWYENSVEGLAVRTALERMISAQLKAQLKAAVFHYYCAQKNGGYLADDPALVPADCQAGRLTAEAVLSRPFHAVWIAGDTADWSSYLAARAKDADDLADEGIFSDPQTAADSLIAVFEVFYNSLRQMIHAAPGFLEETLDQWPHHQPHMALFLTFLKLFQIAQDHLNSLTRRHLDFFYQKVLQFIPKPEVADRVHVIFELAKQADSQLLKAGTLLKAGKDSEDNDVLYQLDRDIVVNRATVAKLMTVFVDRQDHCRVYAAPAADSKDGQGQAFEDEAPRWKPFGESQRQGSRFRPAAEQTMSFAQIGFALASPILKLSEGTRTIQVEITASEDLPADIPLQAEGIKAFTVHLSGEEGWLITRPADVVQQGPRRLIFTINLTAAEGAVVGYDKDIHGGDYRITCPLLMLTLAHNLDGSADYAYQALKDLVISRIDAQVTVKGVRNLIVQNDLGLLDAGKPFQPFGPTPVVGSRFYIGSSEIFHKQVTDLTICYEWLNAPADFTQYYQVYNQYGGAFSDEAFTADIQVLIDRSWEPLRTGFKLFTSREDAGCEHFSMAVSKSTHDPITPPAPALAPVRIYDTGTRQGFVRWELKAPSQAFGHQMYARVYAQQVLAMTQSIDTQDPAPSLPNEPYTPVIKSMALDYTAEVQINLNADDNATTQTDYFFHIHPFGYQKVPVAAGQPLSMLPRFESVDAGQSMEHEGELYIGLADFTPRRNLSLLFQVAEGSADPELPRQPVQWSYLSRHSWQSFAPNEILSDTTNGLLASGIITFDIPWDAVRDHTLLPTGLHWLRAGVSQNSAAVCDLIDVRAQAAQASFVNRNNAADFLVHSLPQDSIKKLQVRQAAIKSVAQPYASFGGKVREQEGHFYARVSERLRHKGRGITLSDYEKLVLENFAGIYKVKCINHSTYNYRGEDSAMLKCVDHRPAHQDDLEVDRSEFAPGFVTLIVIPDLNNKNAVDPLEPRASLNTLEEIRKFLCRRISPFAARRLKVINPLYEKVQVEFGVEFHSGYDRGYYETELNKDIVRFLSPWAFEQGRDITFGGRLHSSVILNFVEERPYVDYVTDFQMNHYTSDPQPLTDVDEAVPTTARSILVSHGQHVINPVENGS